MTLPASFVIGDTWSHTESLSAYQATAGWVLKARFVPRQAGSAIAITYTASGSDHVATVVDTTTWPAGSYSAIQWVEKGVELHTVAQSVIQLLPNARTSSTLDNRTAAQIALDNVRASLQANASQDVLRYMIGGRSLEHYSVSERLKLLDHLAGEVKREQAVADAAAGRPTRRKIFAAVARA